MRSYFRVFLILLSGVSALTQQPKITVTGKLVRVMAIGGESTGWAMELDAPLRIAGKEVTTVEVNVSRIASPDQWLDQRVEATGNLAQRKGVETGPRTIFSAASMKAAVPSPAFSLAGTLWLLEDLAGAGVMDNVQATLGFREEQEVAGNGSCNGFQGPVKISGLAIQFGPLRSGRKACPEAVMNQEAKYLKALQSAARFESKGPYLYLHGTGLASPLRFTRMEPAKKQTAPCEGSTVDQSDAFGPQRATQAKAFLRTLQNAVRSGDRQKLASLIAFPLTVPSHAQVRNTAEFLARYDRIMTPAVARRVLDQSADCLFGNQQGAMIGNGTIWFDQRSGPDFRIITINPAAR